MAKLTPKQQRFVDEFLIDLNATQAYIRAGYSPKSADSNAATLKGNQRVAEAISRAMAELAKRTGVNQERIIREYARIAFADPRKVIEWGPDGVTLRDSSLLDEDDAAIVAEVSETPSEYGRSIKIKFHDKKGALDSLGKHLGMFRDKLDVTIDEPPADARESIAGKLAELAARKRAAEVASPPQ